MERYHYSAEFVVPEDIQVIFKSPEFRDSMQLEYLWISGNCAHALICVRQWQHYHPTIIYDKRSNELWKAFKRVLNNDKMSFSSLDAFEAYSGAHDTERMLFITFTYNLNSRNYNDGGSTPSA